MVAILEKPIFRQRTMPISVALYHEMIENGFSERVELIRGALIEKMPKSPLHTFLTDSLHEQIRALLPEYWVRKEDPLTFTDSEPEPDVSVVPGNRASYRTGHPTTAMLVVEVAVSSAEIDREKAALYAEAGVAEYWLVLADERAVEIHTVPTGSLYSVMRRYGSGETLQSTALPQIAVPFDALFPASI